MNKKNIYDCNSSKTCPKGGIKIHEYSSNNNNNNNNNNYIDQLEFYNKLKNQNKPTGVRISQGNNEYNEDPFAGLNPFTSKDDEQFNSLVYDKTSYNKLDLNIDNYSREDLFKLFGLKSMSLTTDIMKECKKTVLKTHPDKSRLDEKYFIFFSTAYKRLLSIYEFQNKTISKKTDTNEFSDTANTEILNKVFDTNKNLKDPKSFNHWFNEQFEKHRLEDPVEKGYGNWLKSDEDIVITPNVSKANMGLEIEKRKKQVQSITVYKGVSDNMSTSFGGSSLMDYNNNFTSGSLFSSDGMGYTDLRQAYVESVIPVTEDDYNKTRKFKSVDEYKRHRDSAETKPLEKEEAMRQLYQQNKQKDEESAALAFYYAQQAEKLKEKKSNFWSGLKQLTNS